MSDGLELVSVKRADDTAQCRQCGQDIPRGRRVALVLGVGDICLRCWLANRERPVTARSGRDLDIAAAMKDDGETDTAANPARRRQDRLHPDHAASG